MLTPETHQTNNMPPRAALRPREAAHALGVSPSKIAKMLATGELRSVKLGWARLIPVDAIDEILARSNTAHSIQERT